MPKPDKQYRVRSLDVPDVKAYIIPGTPGHVIYAPRDQPTDRRRDNDGYGTCRFSPSRHRGRSPAFGREFEQYGAPRRRDRSPSPAMWLRRPDFSPHLYGRERCPYDTDKRGRSRSDSRGRSPSRNAVYPLSEDLYDRQYSRGRGRTVERTDPWIRDKAGTSRGFRNVDWTTKEKVGSRSRSFERSRPGSQDSHRAMSLGSLIAALNARDAKLNPVLAARGAFGRVATKLDPLKDKRARSLDGWGPTLSHDGSRHREPHQHFGAASHSSSRSPSETFRKPQTITTLWGPYTSLDLVKASSSYTEIEIPCSPLSNIDDDTIPLITLQAAHPIPRRYLRCLSTEELRFVGEVVDEEVFGIRGASERHVNMVETLERVNELLGTEGEVGVGRGGKAKGGEDVEGAA